MSGRQQNLATSFRWCIKYGGSLRRVKAAGLLFLAVVAVIAGLRSSRAEETASPIRFRPVQPPGGFDFRLENSATARKHLPETMAGGIAAFDFDSDGLTDVFFANGAAMPSLVKDSPRYWNRLFRNLGGMRFQDVTAEAGVKGEGYSMAAAAADFDNDGREDLFVAGVRRNTLYRNRGDGTFEDVTQKAGIASGEWSIGAAWLDYDNDGRLDLFVVNYVRWTPEFDQFCGDAARNIRVYCHPRLFEGTANRLYRNLGGGRFEDVSESSGISKHIGKGMAVSVADYDGDGFPDLFVTNDKMPNFLFHNLRNGKFEEVAFDAGVALADTGTEMSAMGTDFRDADNDGRPDVVLTALAGETFPFFRNKGRGAFGDASYASRLGPASRVYSGWGVGLMDFDNDGWKDIFTANSHVSDRVEDFEATEYRQHNGIFRNVGNGRFEDVSRRVGPEFGQAMAAHRGCAFADFDNDGRIDVVVSSLGGVAELWHNTSPAPNTWLILKLRGTASNRDGIGAVIRIGSQTNHMTTSIGYASSSNFGVHFGTGQAKQIERIEIRWPSGISQILQNVRTNRVVEVREPDQGRAARDARSRS
jgi:enediyne biosynthesis protein E4